MKMTTPPLACVASGERECQTGSGCDQNAEQRIQESGKRKKNKIGFLVADKVDWMGREKVK